MPASVLRWPPLHDVLWTPGDVLYLPRGYVHGRSASSWRNGWSRRRSSGGRCTRTSTGSARARYDRSANETYVAEAVRDALACIATEISAESVERHLGVKYRTHKRARGSDADGAVPRGCRRGALVQC